MAATEGNGVEMTIADDSVATKYKLAGEIVNRTLETLISLVAPEKSVKEICEKGDQLLLEETSKIFQKEKEIKKGIAFPTCLSVNNCICHFSPTKNDPDYVLKEGDIVKIDLGAHIDGYIAVAAHTVVAQADVAAKVTGRAADVILAAYWASQAALRLFTPGTANFAITDSVQKIASEYKCNPIQDMLSHQLKQFKIDGEKTIIQNPNEAQQKQHEKCEFQLHEVYAIDVLISTGDGIGHEKDTKASIFKKSDENYTLKSKASRAFISDVISKHGNMPFNIRDFEDETKAVNDCISHKVIEPFEVLYEKPNEIVAQFKFTVLLMPSGMSLVTGLPFDANKFVSSHSILDAEFKDLIFSPNRSVKHKAGDKGASNTTPHRIVVRTSPTKKQRLNVKDPVEVFMNLNIRDGASKPGRKRQQKTRRKLNLAESQQNGTSNGVVIKALGEVVQSVANGIENAATNAIDKSDFKPALEASENISSSNKEDEFTVPINAAPRRVHNTQMTDFFPIRRSGRKTKQAVQQEISEHIEMAIEKQLEDGLVVKMFEEKGRGIVAGRMFKRGEFVVEYIGELIDQTEADRREEKYSQKVDFGCYMYYFKHKEQQWCIDATAETGKLGRLVNHSRNGNLMTKIVSYKDKPHLVLLAKDDIKEGVELTYDYGDRRKEALIHHPWLAF